MVDDGNWHFIDMTEAAYIAYVNHTGDYTTEIIDDEKGLRVKIVCEKEGKTYWANRVVGSLLSIDGKTLNSPDNHTIYHGPSYEDSGPIIYPERHVMGGHLDMDLDEIHAAQDLVNGG